MRALLKQFDVRVSVIYGIVATLWIVLSDTLTALFFSGNQAMSMTISLVKGLGFVGVTTLALSAVLYNELRKRRRAEQALAQSEERYRHIVEDQTELISRYRPDFTLTFVNRAYSELYGEPPEALIGQNFFDLVPAAEREELRAHIAQLSAARPVATAEHRSVLPDGSERWIQWTDRAILDEAGQIVEYQGVGRDFTERKLAEDAEREQHRFAEALLDSLAALTASLDVDQVLRQILDYAAAVVPSEVGSIVLFEGDQARVAYSRGFTQEAETFFKDYRIPIDNVNYWKACMNRTPYLVTDTKSAPDWVSLPVTAWIRSSIGIPIEIQGRVIGLLVADSAAPNRFQQKDVDRLQAFARYAGLALQNAYHVTYLEQKVMERTAELNAAKERVEAILNNSLDGVLLAHTDLRIQQTNAAFNTLFACQPDDYFNRSLLDIICPDDVNRVSPVIQAVLAERVGKHIEACCCRQDGATFDAELSLGYLRTADNLTVGLVCTIHDITERKKAEQALRESEERFRLLMESAPAAIVISNREGRITLLNAEAEKMFGYKRDELIGQNIEILVPEPLRSRHQDHREGFTKLPSQRPAGKERILQSRRKDGSIFQSEIALSYIEAQGDLLVMSVIADITERTQADEALRASEARFRSVIEAAPDSILLLDPEGTILMTNPAALHDSGYDRAEMIGHRLAEFFTPHSQAVFASVFLRLLKTGIGREEVQFVRKDGSIAFMDCSGSVIYGKDGQPHSVIIVQRDMTRRKQVEDALRQTLQKEKELKELKSRFVSTVSHEFRTPLATILSSASLVKDYYERLTDEKRRTHLEKIETQVRYVTEMLDDVLAFSKVEAALLSFNPAPVALDELCRAIVEEIQQAARATHRIIFSSTGDCGEAIVDKKLMQQAITNLLTNAVKYSPGGGNIYLDLGCADSQAVIRVRDEGLGIPKEEQARVFDEFYRATNVGKIEGTGLGLSIAKRAAEMHGGTISLESEPGVGTTFTITIPTVDERRPAQ